jgi:hypothetical protein
LATTSVERRVLELHFKTLAVEKGFYNSKSKKFPENWESEGLYQSNLNIVREYLKGGWTATELEDAIRSRYQAGERAMLISEVLPKKAPNKRVEERDNLLEEGLVYQHPALYDVRPPTFITMGEEMFQSAPPAHRKRECFTFEDLGKYYFKNLKVGMTPRNWTAALGGFRYLLQDYRLDEVLHAIDIAREEQPDTMVLELQKYLPEARKEVEMRLSRSL